MSYANNVLGLTPEEKETLEKKEREEKVHKLNLTRYPVSNDCYTCNMHIV